MKTEKSASRTRQTEAGGDSDRDQAMTRENATFSLGYDSSLWLVLICVFICSIRL